MKKILFLICLMGVTSWSFAQSNDIPQRDKLNVSSFVGYPLTIGDTTIDNIQLLVNKIVPMDVELDSMPRFQIGAIPNQTVWHEGDITVGFYVLTDTLHATNVVLSYTIDFPPQGKITFNEKTGRFKYFPDKFDTRPFTVTFTAKSGNKIIVQDVLFTLMPATSPEYAAFGVEPVKPMPPSTDDYTIVAQTIQRNVQFNNIVRDTVRSFSITGKELVFDSHISNKLRYLNGSEDMKELNIFAEKVIVRDVLHFPQTNITIYAKELVFEDLPNQPPASINTSPVMFSTLGDTKGANGANAGSITLYIKEFRQSNPYIRFTLVGGKGQNVPWTTQQQTRTAGNGGSGGTITSTIEVSELCDVIHGSAGIQIDGSNNIVGAGTHGQDGSFVLYDKEFTWLHPNFISAIVKHAKDAYLNVYNGYTYNIFSEYTQRIEDLKASGEWNALDDEAKMELDNSETEMQAVMFRISQNLDYFGNPVGWVPMLSFEINKLAFEQEIDKAIKVMYLSYWLKNIESSNVDRINACNEAIMMVKQELADCKINLNNFVLLIPELQDEATDLERQIDEMILRIEAKTKELLSKAKNNVKKQNRYNKVSGVLSAVAKVAPVACSIVPGLGTAVGVAISAVVTAGNTALAKATNALDTYGYADTVGGFMGVADGFLQSGGFSSITNALNGIDISSLGSTYNTVKDAYTTINNTVDPLVKSVEKLHKVFAQSSTPNNQVQAELDRLKAESKEYHALIAESEMLNKRKEDLMNKLASTFNNITTAGVEVQKNIVAIDGLSRDVFNNNSKRDLRAMQYLDDMERRAKERLLKYHYYMAKSYEYRLLKPYTAELNLSTIMDRFITIAEANPNQPVLNATNFQDLKAIYEEQISTVTANILDEYNANRPELSSTIRFSATQNDIAGLNDGNGFNLNIYERGMIPPNHENVRIVSFKIHNIKVHLEGDINPSFANFELLLEHSGLSMMRKNGEIYWFNHINNQNQNPITWGITYDAKHGIVDEQKPSYASQSLLYSILDKLGKTSDIMIYSRPGAWADIYISRHNVVSGNTQMIIDSLTFELQYDFVQRPSNNRNLDVYAIDVDNSAISLSPYIEILTTDKSGRANGRGTLYRTYGNYATPTLTAPEEYGRYKFVNWTNRYGEEVSIQTQVKANMSNDVALTANYKYLGPILSVQDTVYIGQEQGTTSIKVENKGSEEMEWSSISNQPWIRIIGGEEGINNDFVIIEFDSNPTKKRRVGSITVTAPESEKYSSIVYIVQSQDSTTTGLLDTPIGEALKPKIYYGPSSGYYTVDLMQNAKNISIEVFNIRGQQILHTYDYNKSSFDLDLSFCSSGVYIIKILYDGKYSTYKVVKP